MSTEQVFTLSQLLEKSAATEAFQDAVSALEQKNQPTDRVVFGRTSPPVKVLRAVAWLLEQEPQLAIDRVEVDAHTGCADFVGKMTVGVEGETESRMYEFAWDCKWKADQFDWKDALGFSDQARAAREFGYKCMKSWERVEASAPVNA